jgi:hypothetical protein
MSQPNFYQVHQDVPLTNLSIAFFQDPASYGLLNLFPRVPTPHQSGKYYTFDRAYFLGDFAQKRAAGGAAPLGGYAIGTANFFVERDAIGKAINDPERANADPQVNLEANATRWINQQLLIKMESRFAAKYWTTGVWTGSTTGSDIVPSVLWNDDASDPVADITTQKRAVNQQFGADYIPNVLALGAKVFDDLCQHPDLIDRIKYMAGPGNPAIVNEQTLAQVFGVSRIVVLRAIKNTAGEGATASYDFICDETDALLCYAAPSPGMETPSAGYTFMWTGAPDGSSFGPAIKRWRDEKHESDVLEGNVWYNPYVVTAGLGVYFNGAVSA